MSVETIPRIPSQAEPVSGAPMGAANPLEVAQAGQAGAQGNLEMFDRINGGRPLNDQDTRNLRLGLDADVRAAESRVADAINAESMRHIRRARPTAEPATPTTVDSQAFWERAAANAERQIADTPGYVDAGRREQQDLLADFDATHAAPLSPEDTDARAQIERNIQALDAHTPAHHQARAAEAQRHLRHSARHEARGSELRLTHTTAELDELNLAATERVRGEFVDPRTGNTVQNVDGSAADRIRENREYGNTVEQRNEVAELYERTIDEALQSGAEMSQAELIAGLALNNRDRINDLTAEFVRSGVAPQEAAERAQAQYARLFRTQRQFVLENNIMTTQEYQAARDQQRAEQAHRNDVRSQADRERNRHIAAGEHPARGVADPNDPRGERPRRHEATPNDPTDPTNPNGSRLGYEFPTNLPANIQVAIQEVAEAKIAAERTAQRGIRWMNRRRNMHSTGSESRMSTLQDAQERLSRLIDRQTLSPNPIEDRRLKFERKLEAARGVLLYQVGESMDRETGRVSRFMAGEGRFRRLLPVLARRAQNTSEPVRERAEALYDQILSDVERYADYASQGNAINAAIYRATETHRTGNTQSGIVGTQYRARLRAALGRAPQPRPAQPIRTPGEVAQAAAQEALDRSDRRRAVLGNLARRNAEAEEARRAAETEN